MWKWLADNKDWLFEGGLVAGPLAAISGIWAIIVYRRRGNDSQSASSHQQVHSRAVVAQADGDVTVSISQGISTKDVLEIAEHVVAQRLDGYHKAAVATAVERQESWRHALVSRIERLEIRQLDAFTDPDVQAAVADAQTAYARSGSPEVGRTLIDLVTARSSASPGSLEASVINEAIRLVGKLSPSGIAALTVSFVTSEILSPTVSDRASFLAWIEANVAPFLDKVPTAAVEYEHLTALGCIRRQGNFLTPEPGQVLVNNYPGLFQTGLSPHAIKTEIWEAHEQGGNLFEPSEFGAEAYRVKAATTEQAYRLYDSAPSAKPEFRDEFFQLIVMNQASGKEALRLAAQWHPAMQRLAELWLETPFNSVILTTTGIAIGHSNWAGATGATEPLSTWISG
jgi:hypothetical protein